jgi:thiol-disulfide isomerase/thioredoxin
LVNFDTILYKYKFDIAKLKKFLEMKKIFSFLFAAMMLLSCNNAGVKTLVDLHHGQPMLVGLGTRKDLQQEPYVKWFKNQYDNYKLNKAYLDSLKGHNFSMVIVMATWCPDSRREVPRMFKILDSLHYTGKVPIYYLDRHWKAGKYDPVKKYQIHRIPTFIIYVNGKEVGRIIEHPKKSLEIDLYQILK